MTLKILPITGADVIPLEAIRVTEEQDNFVAPNPVTIAQVRFHTGAEDFCIWDGEQRVGLLAVIDNTCHGDLDEIDDPQAAYIWRLLIGVEFQGRGYGTAAIAFAEDWARKRGRPVIQVQAVEANAPALRLYQRLGYALTGARSGDELQLTKAL